MKIILLPVLLLAFVCLKAQTKDNYLHPEFDSIIADHRTIAILPFDVTINLRPLEEKYMKPGGLESLQKYEGLAIQKALDAYLFKQKLKKEFKIEVQDTDSTNRLLREKGWTRDSLIQKSSDVVCAHLGVDAVISGTFTVNRPVSKDVSKAFMIATGGFHLNTISGDCIFYVHNGGKGELLWRYKKRFAYGPTTNPDQMINLIMKGAARKLPYEDQK